MADFSAYPYELEEQRKKLPKEVKKDGIKERRKKQERKIKKQKRQCNFPSNTLVLCPLILTPQVTRGRTNKPLWTHWFVKPRKIGNGLQRIKVEMIPRQVT